MTTEKIAAVRSAHAEIEAKLASFDAERNPAEQNFRAKTELQPLLAEHSSLFREVGQSFVDDTIDAIAAVIRPWHPDQRRTREIILQGFDFLAVTQQDVRRSPQSFVHPDQARGALGKMLGVFNKVLIATNAAF